MATQYTAGLTSGQVLTAAIMNQIGAAWETYTPVFSAALGGCVIGNGTITGRYGRINKIVCGQIKMVCGSTTTYGFGDALRFSLPITGNASPSNYQIIGSGYVIDASTAQSVIIMGDRKNTNNNIGGRLTAGGYGDMTSVAPFAFATNDEIFIQFLYEAA